MAVLHVGGVRGRVDILRSAHVLRANVAVAVVLREGAGLCFCHDWIVPYDARAAVGRIELAVHGRRCSNVRDTTSSADATIGAAIIIDDTR